MQPQDAQFVGVVVEFDRQPLPQMCAQASVCASRSSANRPCRPSHRSAPAAGSDVATSRPVTKVTTFSTDSDWPAASSAKMSWPISNSSSTSRYVAGAGARRATRWSAPPARSGSATALSRTVSSTELSVTAHACPATPSGCWPGPGSARPASWPTLPSSVERISIVPDQSSATIVVSSAATWAMCIATNRCWVTEVVRPASSRKRSCAGQHRAAKIERLAVGQQRRPRRRRTSRRRRCGTSAEASWEDSPGFRVPVVVPATTSSRRLYTPAA